MDMNEIKAQLKKNAPLVWLAAAVVAAYFGYRWYQNRQAANAASGTSTAAGSQLGTNLNSTAPDLVAGSQGPNSGLSYYAGQTQVTLSQPASQTAVQPSPGNAMNGSPSGNINPGGPNQPVSQPTGAGGSQPAQPANPASGGNWAFPMPGGLHTAKVASNGYTLQWQPVAGPSGQKPASYTVRTYDSSGKQVDNIAAVTGTSTPEYGAGGKGLPKGSYKSEVWANGGPEAPPHATVTVSLSK